MSLDPTALLAELAAIRGDVKTACMVAILPAALDALESARRERDELEVWSVVARGRGQTIEALTVDLAATKGFV